MPKMRAVQVPGPNLAFQLVEREIPEPTEETVRIKVEACGICHSDSFIKEGTFPGIIYPRIPGHEVAGVIDAVGSKVTEWVVGQRVGVGWLGGYCGKCTSCRKGDFNTCKKFQVTGISFDGGYAEYMIAPVESLALIPDELSAVEAGPLMCAGITTFNSLRHSQAKPGDVVAILGIGGLGHLAVQYANKMGFHTVAIARGKDKTELAKKLGAKNYIDSETQDIAAELQKLGGAKVILSTISQSEMTGKTIEGLGACGQLVIVGASPDPIKISPLSIIRARRSIQGWPSGTSIDSEETMAFSALTGVRSMNQIFPLEKAAEAYELMMSGKARFRIVLTMNSVLKRQGSIWKGFRTPSK